MRVISYMPKFKQLMIMELLHVMELKSILTIFLILEGLYLDIQLVLVARISNILILI